MTLRTLPALAALLLAAPAAAQDKPGVTATLDHVAIWVADQQKSIDFYQAVFGLSEIPSPFPPGGPRWMILANGVELHIQGGRTEPLAQPRRVHMAIGVPSIDPVMARLRARRMGWSDMQGNAGAINATRTDGVRQIFVQDPDGYWIEVNDAKRR